MADGKPNFYSDGRIRRLKGDRGGSRPTKQRAFIERATAEGHSGHGSESVRPHLRDQLRLKALLPTPFPVPEVQQRGEEEPQ
jgi:hypothetical protein